VKCTIYIRTCLHGLEVTSQYSADNKVGLEVALQQFFCNGQIVFAVGGDDKLSFAPGLNTVLFHHAPYALLAHPDP